MIQYADYGFKNDSLHDTVIIKEVSAFDLA